MKFAYVTWATSPTNYHWMFEPVCNLPALLDGLSLFLTPFKA